MKDIFLNSMTSLINSYEGKETYNNLVTNLKEVVLKIEKIKEITSETYLKINNRIELPLWKIFTNPSAREITQIVLLLDTKEVKIEVI